MKRIGKKKEKKHNCLIGVSNTAIDNNIKYLRENGYIERIGENKNGSWKVLK